MVSPIELILLALFILPLGDLPSVHQESFDHVNDIRSGLLPVIEQPPATLHYRHIRHKEDGVVPGTIGEVPSGTTIGREGLILELVKIEALCFITNS